MRHALLAAALVLTVVGPAHAQKKQAIDGAVVDKTMKEGFATAAPDWQARLEQDETQKQCSQYRNVPPRAVAEAIVAREKANIAYPADGKLMGDWKKGEAIAQSGYGQRFTDYPARSPNGGNCYACHQMTTAEVSYGTVGPSLLEYGKIRKFAEADVKAVYDKIYNAHAAFPCSLMPRFGSNDVLSIEEIKDLVALVMSPESPVNN